MQSESVYTEAHDYPSLRNLPPNVKSDRKLYRSQDFKAQQQAQELPRGYVTAVYDDPKADYDDDKDDDGEVALVLPIDRQSYQRPDLKGDILFVSRGQEVSAVTEAHDDLS